MLKEKIKNKSIPIDRAHGASLAWFSFNIDSVSLGQAQWALMPIG